jgi:alanine racemase
LKRKKILDGPVRPTVAEIDLRALAENFRALRLAVGPAVGVIAVVKADAYGHGAAAVARLLEGLGIRGLGVATVEEGVVLRAAGIRCPVLIMGAAFGRDHEAVIANDLLPMVGDAADIDPFAEAAKRLGRVRYGIHIKVDTGMSRLGVTVPAFAAVLRQCASYPSLRLDGMATHFACADDRDPGQTERQLQQFIKCLDLARTMGADPQWIHAANSAAALRFPRARFDLIRPGIVLYGASPGEHVPALELKPVMSLRTRINAIREVPSGTPISYGGTFVTKRWSKIATIPVGYADGYPRSLSNRGWVIIRGKRAPLVGNICMDLTLVDVTEVDKVGVGDSVVLLGQDGEERIGAADLAAWAGTISYEILARVSVRVPRSYVGGDQSDLGAP